MTPSPPSPTRIRDSHIAALALLALLQFGWQVRSVWVNRIPADHLPIGLSVSEVVTVDREGAREVLAPGTPTLLLVFHTDCPQCAAVASEWSSWLHEAPASQVLAVSSEPVDVGRGYAARHAWNVDVRMVEDAARYDGGPAHRLTARTPYVVLISGDGKVLDRGPASELARISHRLSSLLSETPHA